MKLRIPQILLMVVVLGTLGVFAMAFAGQITWFSTKPPYEIQPGLDHQFRAIPQSPNTFFSDGKSMRDPVEGTVARGVQVYALQAGDVDAAETANVEPEDLPKNNEFVMSRGQNRFNVYCAPCHNYDAKGQSALVRRGSWTGGRVPPDLTIEPAITFSNARLFHIISAGQGIMPSYSDKIDPVDRWAIIRYLRSLQGVEGVASNATPAAAAKN